MMFSSEPTSYCPDLLDIFLLLITEYIALFSNMFFFIKIWNSSTISVQGNVNLDLLCGTWLEVYTNQQL